jgi:hypothetical protein
VRPVWGAGFRADHGQSGSYAFGSGPRNAIGNADSPESIVHEPRCSVAVDSTRLSRSISKSTFAPESSQGSDRIILFHLAEKRGLGNPRYSRPGGRRYQFADSSEEKEQPQILRLTTPKLKNVWGPFAQDERSYSDRNFWDGTVVNP